MSATCRCGCGNPVRVASRSDKRVGHVKGQPVNYVRGHGPRRNGVRYIVDAASGCWNWNGAITAEGYGGIIPTPSGLKRPHRVMYEAAKGPVPAGMDLDHLCRNRRCVNPDHLEPVTEAENVRRGKSAKLTVQSVRLIREAAGSRSRQKLAAEYGVSPSAISLVLRRKTWAEV